MREQHCRRPPVPLDESPPAATDRQSTHPMPLSDPTPVMMHTLSLSLPERGAVWRWLRILSKRARVRLKKSESSAWILDRTLTYLYSPGAMAWWGRCRERGGRCACAWGLLGGESLLNGWIGLHRALWAGLYVRRCAGDRLDI